MYSNPNGVGNIDVFLVKHSEVMRIFRKMTFCEQGTPIILQDFCLPGVLCVAVKHIFPDHILSFFKYDVIFRHDIRP